MLGSEFFGFIFNAILFGFGLAMDAFTVSLANGLANPCMQKRRILSIALTFAVFQAAMPLTGWLLVHTVVEYFSALKSIIPFIATLLLLYIGGKMLFDGLSAKKAEADTTSLGAGTLALQGIATSIDALSVGFTISELNFGMAFLECSIISAVTFLICLSGVIMGRKFGTRLAGKATALGGLILIFIGAEIFISSLL